MARTKPQYAYVARVETDDEPLWMIARQAGEIWLCICPSEWLSNKQRARYSGIDSFHSLSVAVGVEDNQHITIYFDKPVNLTTVVLGHWYNVTTYDVPETMFFDEGIRWYFDVNWTN